MLLDWKPLYCLFEIALLKERDSVSAECGELHFSGDAASAGSEADVQKTGWRKDADLADGLQPGPFRARGICIPGALCISERLGALQRADCGADDRGVCVPVGVTIGGRAGNAAA